MKNILAAFILVLSITSSVYSNTKVTELASFELEDSSTITILCLDGVKWVLVPGTSLEPVIAKNGAYLLCRN